jgi:sigma-B regulation protein RsbU (phosphoserine phosphatase)
MALGVEESYVYAGAVREGLAAGDIVLISTDGVWETHNPEGQTFGKTRVADVVQAHRDRSAEGIVQALLEALAHFRGRAAQEDDVTLVVVKAVPVQTS